MNTVPDEPDELRAQWWAGLAEALLDIGRRVGQLAEQIGLDWPDPAGREWAERAAQVRVELGREADAAAELGAGYARGLPVPGSVDRRTGARLGGTEASRVDDERGIRIAELPEPPP